MTTVLYESPGSWLRVMKTPKGFFYSERKGKNSVAVFLIRGSSKSREVLIRYQPLPVSNNPIGIDEELYACPITGSIDEGEEPYAAAVRKVMEEAGYDVSSTSEEDSYLGQYYIGTQTNEEVYLYFFDVSKITPTKAEGDGTYFEAISKNEWEPIDNLLDSFYMPCITGYYLLLRRVYDLWE